MNSKLRMPQSSAAPKQSKPASAPKRGSTSAAELEIIKEKIADKIRTNPDKAAIILTEWLKQGPTPHKKSK